LRAEPKFERQKGAGGARSGYGEIEWVHVLRITLISGSQGTTKKMGGENDSPPISESIRASLAHKTGPESVYRAYFFLAAFLAGAFFAGAFLATGFFGGELLDRGLLGCFFSGFFYGH